MYLENIINWVRFGITELWSNLQDSVANISSAGQFKALTKTRLSPNFVFVTGNTAANALLSFAFCILGSRTYSVEAKEVGSPVVLSRMSLFLGVSRALAAGSLALRPVKHLVATGLAGFIIAVGIDPSREQSSIYGKFQLQATSRR